MVQAPLSVGERVRLLVPRWQETLPVLLYLGVAGWMADADWGRGAERGGLLLLTVLASWRLHIPSPGAQVDDRNRALMVVACSAVGLRILQWLLPVTGEPVREIDIATTTDAAIRALLDGHHPYSTAVDVRPESTDHAGGTGFYDGYKYGPLLLLLYAPASISGGWQAFIHVNLVGYLVACGLVVQLARAAWGRPGAAAGHLAVALFALTTFAWRETLVKPTNDLLATTWVLGAVLARHRGWPAVAGALVGAGFACKFLPAALVAMLLLPGPGTLRMVLGAVGVAVAAYAPFLLTAPHETVANLLLFNASRPADSTGLVGVLPDMVRAPVRTMLGVAFLAAVAVHVRRGRHDVEAILRGWLMVVPLFLLTSSIHRNYLLWMVPAWVLAAAAWALAGRERDQPASGAYGP